MKFFDLRIEKDFQHFSVLELLENRVKNLFYTPLPINSEYYGSLLTETPTTFEFVSIKTND
ncbi:hypothetical protein MX850_05380 [Erysipelothrix sp. Poltava]|nr:hypothetical protein MX850_05380 [Erysipelothrix sp. Poltava]